MYIRETYHITTDRKLDVVLYTQMTLNCFQASPKSGCSRTNSAREDISEQERISGTLQLSMSALLRCRINRWNRFQQQNKMDE
jgi:hypothetical protein